jgi:hypothetical protein
MKSEVRLIDTRSSSECTLAVAASIPVLPLHLQMFVCTAFLCSHGNIENIRPAAITSQGHTHRALHPTDPSEVRLDVNCLECLVTPFFPLLQVGGRDSQCDKHLFNALTFASTEFSRSSQCTGAHLLFLLLLSKYSIGSTKSNGCQLSGIRNLPSVHP